MRNEKNIVWQSNQKNRQVAAYEVVLKLLHGELIAGRPVFLVVSIQQKNEPIEVINLSGHLMIERIDEEGFNLTEALQPTRVGLMKEVLFPDSGQYCATILFDHGSAHEQAQFTLYVEEGTNRSDPVG